MKDNNPLFRYFAVLLLLLPHEGPSGRRAWATDLSMKPIAALRTLVVILLSAASLPGQIPGFLDMTFQAQIPTDFAYQLFTPLAVQPDGKILVGGHSSSADSGSWFLARLRSDGALDSGFSPKGITGCGQWMFPEGTRGGCSGGAFSSILGQADGKILLSGYQWGAPELHQDGLARLNANGSVDPTFVTNPRRSWDVRKLVRLSNGSILVSLCCGERSFPWYAWSPMEQSIPGSRRTFKSPMGGSMVSQSSQMAGSCSRSQQPLWKARNGT